MKTLEHLEQLEELLLLDARALLQQRLDARLELGELRLEVRDLLVLLREQALPGPATLLT